MGEVEVSIPTQVSFILDKKCPPFDAASAAFLSFKAKVFDEHVFEFDKIQRKVSDKFKVSLGQVLVCGSAQFSYSCFKKTPFVAGKSDLDLAIVSSELYARMFDVALDSTRGFIDFTYFADVETRDSFFYYAGRRGMIRPDLLPRCGEKTIWDNFFRQLTGQYKQRFRSISGAIYLSESSFVYKQIPCVLAARGEQV